MNWEEQSKQIINKIISDIGITDKDLLRKRIDEECPFEVKDSFAMKKWREEKRKVISPIFSNKKISPKKEKKIKNFNDNKEEEF